jgi:hypothetical protein
MATQIQIAPSSDIEVGTTPVTSGTDGRIFFQDGGVVQQDGALLWDNTNKRLGVGASPATTVRLDVRAQGALSTDVAFRVRNSADTRDIFAVSGNGSVFNRGNSGLAGSTAFGESALSANTTGLNNTAFGFDALTSLTTGGGNTALGRDALRNGNTSSCVAIGQSALISCTADNNTAVGFNAGNITSGVENVVLGYSAMGQSPVKTGQRNISIGSFSMTALSSGASNISIGRNTGSNITTGSFNTLIGENLSTPAASSSNFVILADGQGNRAITKDNNNNIYTGADSALSTSATNGFFYIPTCAGLPTGVPTSITGKVPIVADTTGNKLYVYLGGSWVAMN